jgi:uncharacterized protein YciI
MLFAVIAVDKPNSLALRLSVREQHFAFAKATGKIRLGGPFLDAKDEMCGSLMIVEAADLDEVKAWHASDPYVKAGLFAASEIRPWKATFNPCEAKF